MRTRSRPALYYEDRGSGEPALLVTGWTISSAIFDPVAALYAPHARCVTYDHRGTGRSATWIAPVSIAMLATDGARLLDDLDIDSAHVVGVSMGVAVALELALRMPHRVRSLVLMGGHAGGPRSVLPAAREGMATLSELARDSLRRGRPWPAAALFSEQFRREHPDQVRALLRPFAQHRAPPWSIGAQTLAVSCFDRAGCLHRVQAPTLVMHGDQDAMVPVANGRALARGIPNAEMHVVPGGAHAFALERPQETADVVVDFIRRQGDRHVLPAPGAWQRASERLSRPFALHTGTLRATGNLLTRRGRW